MSIIFTVISQIMRKKKREKEQMGEDFDYEDEKIKTPGKPEHTPQKEQLLNLPRENE